MEVTEMIKVWKKGEEEEEKETATEMSHESSCFDSYGLWHILLSSFYNQVGCFSYRIPGLIRFCF